MWERNWKHIFSLGESEKTRKLGRMEMGARSNQSIMNHPPISPLTKDIGKSSQSYKLNTFQKCRPKPGARIWWWSRWRNVVSPPPSETLVRRSYDSALNTIERRFHQDLTFAWKKFHRLSRESIGPRTNPGARSKLGLDEGDIECNEIVPPRGRALSTSSGGLRCVWIQTC